MPSRSRIAAPLAVALAALILLGCPPPDDADAPRTRAAGAEAEPGARDDLSRYLRPVVDQVTIRVNGCQPPAMALDVVIEPMEAHVVQGTDFAWVLEGSPPARIQIRPKAGPWPFDLQQFDEVQAEQGRRIAAGRATAAAPGDRARYAVFIRCGQATVNIDPEIVIRDPNFPPNP